MRPKEILVSRIFAEARDELGLELVTAGLNLDIAVTCPDIGRPGLLLAGFDEGFLAGRIQILGRTEVLYLSKLDDATAQRALRSLLSKAVPCLIVTQGMALPGRLAELAAQAEVPVFSTPRSSTETVQYLSSYLGSELAPEVGISGTLVDVYGVGILLRGKSGIGKSECALDLVERGHRLVADDLVRVISKPPGVLIGRSSEPLQNYVEVRGIGLVDIGSIFGIRALRRQKRIEIEANLKEWGEDGFSYDRSGLEYKQVEILGVRIPSMVVPLVAGKSVSVIIEVIALSHVLGIYGYDAADSLREKLVARLKRAGMTGFIARDIE
ncbi:MAG TPA: HPr(Ser) kinase/phosphatase [bacterium]|nr:HPr(Ser) kinase/phosphatase [bacterium]